MDNWDEVRTAYQVARIGTVSGAAEVLGVHHATVIRHVDALETRLKVKLFQRHARGYTPTEAGQDLLRVAQATDDQFGQLAGRLLGQGDEVTGELVVTSLISMAPQIVPILTDFQRMHPGLIVRYLTGDRLFRLEYGEAHVAIRAGAVPEQPDNVVQKFTSQNFSLYASKAYAECNGLPDGEDDFAGHSFVCHDDSGSRAPAAKWMWATVPADQITFRSADVRALEEAIVAGAGIGIMGCWDAAQRDDLVQVMPPRDAWTGDIWLVTHVDLHRTNKVQAFLTYLKARAQDWTN